MAFNYYRDVLPSGLRVVTIETPHLHTAMVAVYVRVGSRHETPENNGATHFLEHMFFRGSERFPDTVRMNSMVEDVGGNLNGVTTRDQCYYFTPVHPSHIGVALEVLGDMLTRPRLVDMEVERQVILEEMLDEVDEDGKDIDLDNLVKMHVFGRHPMAMKIAGTRDSVTRLQKAQLEAHLERFYVTGNVVVAVSGPVKRDEVLDIVSRRFDALRTGGSADEVPPPPPPGGPWFKHIEHDEAQTEFRILFPTVAELHPDHPSLQLLRRVLDDGLSSRLPFNIVEKRGLAYSIHGGLEVYADCGFFEVDAACAPEKAGLVVEAVCETLAEVCANGVTAEELDRAQRRHRMFLDFAQDSPAELVGWFGGTELFHPPETFEQRVAKVEALDVRAVRAVARRYFRKANLGVVAVGQRRGIKALERVVSAAPLP